MARLTRALLLARRHLPDQIGINPRGVFYERNGWRIRAMRETGT